MLMSGAFLLSRLRQSRRLVNTGKTLNFLSNLIQNIYFQSNHPLRSCKETLETSFMKSIGEKANAGNATQNIYLPFMQKTRIHIQPHTLLHSYTCIY